MEEGPKESRTTREKVLPERPWRKNKNLPGSLKANPGDLLGRYGSYSRSVFFRVHTFTQQGFTKPFSVGSWGTGSAPSPVHKAGSGCRCSGCRTVGIRCCQNLCALCASAKQTWRQWLYFARQSQ